MDPLALTDEQRQIRDLVREFAEKELRPRAIELDAARASSEAARFPREAFAKLGELGILGIPAPEAQGGGGGDPVALAVALEEVARCCGSTAFVLAAHAALATAPLAAHGSEELKGALLPALAGGRKVAAPAFADRKGKPRAAARADGADFVLNGDKAWVTNAPVAEVFIVAARAEDGPSLFAVERGARGLEVRDGPEKLGMRGAPWGDLALDGVRCPAWHRLGGGEKAVRRAHDEAALALAAIATGLIAACLERASAYAEERKAFGQPIGGFPAIQQKVADMALAEHAARLLTRHAAAVAASGRPFAAEARMARLFAAEAAYQAGKEAVQVLGGVGYCREYEVERIWRDAAGCGLIPETADDARMQLAAGLLASARAGRSA